MLVINSVTLLRLHFLQLATTRSSSLFHSFLNIPSFINPIATAPGSTKWLSISHFAWHNLAALPIPSPSRPLDPQSGRRFTLCLAHPGRPSCSPPLLSPSAVSPAFKSLPVRQRLGGSHVEDQDEDFNLSSLFTLTIVHLFHHVSISRLYM
jgi:hypothetical protein